MKVLALCMLLVALGSSANKKAKMIPVYGLLLREARNDYNMNPNITAYECTELCDGYVEFTVGNSENVTDKMCGKICECVVKNGQKAKTKCM